MFNELESEEPLEQPRENFFKKGNPCSKGKELWQRCQLLLLNVQIQIIHFSFLLLFPDPLN